MRNEFKDRNGNLLENPHLIQSHGLTVAQHEALRLKQEAGTVEMMPANNAGETLRDPWFQAYKNHLIPRHEAHIYHVVMDARTFHPNTGEKLSLVVCDKFTPEAYEFLKNHFGFAGKVIHLLHNPELEKS